jgi:hypothetical protein
VTLPPFYGFQTQGNREQIIMLSRARYARKREEIEKEIENKQDQYNIQCKVSIHILTVS